MRAASGLRTMMVLSIALTLCWLSIVALGFPLAATLFLSVFPAIPVILSIDLGAGIPLISATRVLLAPLLLGLVAQFALRRQGPFRFPLAGPLLVLVSAHIFSLLASDRPSVEGWLHTASVAFEETGVYFLACAVLTTWKRIRLFLAGVAVVLVLIMAFNCVTMIVGRNVVAEHALLSREGLVFDYSLGERFGLPRFQSFFRNPLDLGIYLVLAIPATFAFAGSASTRWERILALGALGAGIASAVLAGSRTVIYTLCVSLVAYLLIRRRAALGLTLTVVGVAGVAAITSISHFPVLDYLVRSALLPSLFRGDVGGSSWYSLVRITTEHVRMAMQRPTFGWGVGTLPPNPASAGLDPSLVGFGEQGISYLLVETGVLGLGAFVWLFAKVLGTLWRGATRGASATARRLSVACLVGTLGYLVGIQLEGVWHFGMMLVLAAACSNVMRLAEPC